MASTTAGDTTRLVPGQEVELWEARALRDVGLLIRSYLEQREPPAKSDVAAEFAGIATNMVHGGNLRLTCLEAQSRDPGPAATFAAEPVQSGGA